MLPINHILFIKIETVPIVDEWSNLPPVAQNLWAKKSSFLYPDIPVDTSFMSKAGLFPEYGRVICISMGYYSKKADPGTFKVKTFVEGTEEQILSDFFHTIQHINSKTVKLCAHNGKAFTFPYLCKRGMINGLSIPDTLQLQTAKPWDYPHLDTLDLWKFGDGRCHTSLDTLAMCFNENQSDIIIPGEEVGFYYYKKKNLKGIAQSAEERLKVLAKVYSKMSGYPKPEHISTRKISIR